jgi:hypothetical protein
VDAAADLLERWKLAEQMRMTAEPHSAERAVAERECEDLADRYQLAVRIEEAVEGYLAARRRRALTAYGDHDWANAETAVRFWRQELAYLKATASAAA